MAVTDHVAEARWRAERVPLIQAKLLSLGYGVIRDRINRNFAVFNRWYEGRMALGYLIRQTGIRKNLPAKEGEQ